MIRIGLLILTTFTAVGCGSSPRGSSTETTPDNKLVVAQAASPPVANSSEPPPAVTQRPPLTPEQATAYRDDTFAARTEKDRLIKELQECQDDELRRKAGARLNYLSKKSLKWEIEGAQHEAAAWLRKQIEGKSLEQIVQDAQDEPDTLAPPTSQPPPREITEGPVAKSFYAAKAAADQEQKTWERMYSEAEKFHREKFQPALKRKEAATTPAEKKEAEEEFTKVDAILKDQNAKLTIQSEKIQAAQQKSRELEQKFRNQLRPQP